MSLPYWKSQVVEIFEEKDLFYTVYTMAADDWVRQGAMYQQPKYWLGID